MQSSVYWCRIFWKREFLSYSVVFPVCCQLTWPQPHQTTFEINWNPIWEPHHQTSLLNKCFCGWMGANICIQFPKFGVEVEQVNERNAVPPMGTSEAEQDSCQLLRRCNWKHPDCKHHKLAWFVYGPGQEGLAAGEKERPEHHCIPFSSLQSCYPPPFAQQGLSPYRYDQLRVLLTWRGYYPQIVGKQNWEKCLLPKVSRVKGS